MPTFDVNTPATATDNEWTPLETDAYPMIIAEAKIAPSPFPDDFGNYPEELSITWKLDEWNEAYEAAGYQQGQKVFQHIRYFDNNTRSGQPSKYRQFILDLVHDKCIPTRYFIAGPDEDATQGDLVGVRRRVMVQKYTKTKGTNAGTFGNKVIAVTGFRNTAPATNGQPPTRPVPRMEPQPQPEPDLPLEGAPRRNDPGLTMDERVKYAQEMAKQAGAMFVSKPWDRMDEKKLIAETERMERFIDTRLAAVADPNKDLF